mgnify:CR=1 FL=1
MATKKAKPTKATMMRMEKRETRAQEKRESASWQRLEKRMGVERHGKRGK